MSAGEHGSSTVLRSWFSNPRVQVILEVKPMSRALFATAVLACIPSCGDVPSVEVVAEGMLQELIENRGALGDSAVPNCPPELRNISRTRIPSVDWDEIEEVVAKNRGSRGPGAVAAGPGAFECTAKDCEGVIRLEVGHCPECGKELHVAPRFAIETFQYGSFTFRNLISLMVSFTFIMKDGSEHSGWLALRPIDGELKVIPPPA